MEFLYGEKYICGCINAYSKELMEFYISDSKGTGTLELYSDLIRVVKSVVIPIFTISGMDRLVSTYTIFSILIILL
jgi:hypothetical protein